MSKAPLETRLKRLRLGSLAQSFEAQNTESIRQRHSFLEFRDALVDDEITARENKSLMKRVKAARFPLLKTLEEFDFDLQPKLDVRLVKTLAACNFIVGRCTVLLDTRQEKGDWCPWRTNEGRKARPHRSEDGVRAQDPSLSQSRPRFGCFFGTFRPSCLQIRRTRLWFTLQPSRRRRAVIRR